MVKRSFRDGVNGYSFAKCFDLPSLYETKIKQTWYTNKNLTKMNYFNIWGRKESKWIPPYLNWWKYNVDRFSKGNLGISRI